MSRKSASIVHAGHCATNRVANVRLGGRRGATTRRVSASSTTIRVASIGEASVR
jgi:hypothetical protein